MRVVIIGGTAGGAGIAARLRRLDESVEIVIIEKNPYISWAGCALPYFTGGLIAGRDSLFLADKEMFNRRFNIKVIDGTKAVGIDRNHKCVQVESAILPTKRTECIPYDKLVIATGAAALMPPFAKNVDGVFALRSIEDADHIKAYISEHGVKNAVVVGGGFIGLEACENLHHLGIKVTLVEKAPQVLTVVDPDIAHYLHRELDQHGVSLKLGIGIAGIERNEQGSFNVSLDNGQSVTTDIVIMALGIKPESGFLQGSGLQLNDRGYVVVKDTMQTCDRDIFALGDVVAVEGVPEDRLGTLALAGPASKQARVVASNVLMPSDSLDTELKHFAGSIGVSIVRVMSLTAGAVGANMRMLLAAGMNPLDSRVPMVHTPNHVSCFADAKPVNLKLLFNKHSGLILGAQAVGELSVDKNIEVISALMQKHGTVYDMVDFESAYAPPYSAPRSPVNMAGSTAANVVDGMEDTVTVDKLADFGLENTIFIDVRSKEEVAMGSIPHFINVPVDEMREYFTECPIDPSKNYVVTCQVGVRGHTAACILRALGATHVYNLTGGYVSWATAQYKLQNA